MVRLLTASELLQVQKRLTRPLNSRPEFSGKAAMIAARPAWLPEPAALSLCNVLCADEFVLSPNAPGAWVWQKHIAQTAIQHSLVVMQVMLAGRPWLKSYSHDLCSNLFEDALGDSYPDFGDVAKIQPILALFQQNEAKWHATGFAKVNEI